jgi:ABC-type polar amino acid transport system ATPase subunit
MITLSKVSKWYPNFQVLKHCSTEVAKGEVVVVWVFLASAASGWMTGETIAVGGGYS